jgi:hypothetical protein
MSTPTQYLLDQLSPALQMGMKAAPYVNKFGQTINQLTNPTTPAIVAAPRVAEGASMLGGMINNNKYVSDLLNDPIVRGLAAKNPFTGFILGASDIARGADKLPKLDTKKEKQPEQKPSYKPRREALEELYPDRYKDTETRKNPNNLIQKGRNFNTMAENIFGSMATRAQNAGVSEAILGDINRMNPAAKFSSVHLHSTDTNPFTNLEGSFDSFANPDIAYTTGAVQPRKTEVNFSDPMQRQFKYRDDIPSVVTEPGPKKPVEYTNYMASGDPALSSIDALRMNEQQKGLIYASGQYYAEGADGKAVKVDRDLAKKVKRGAEGADALLANFLGRGGLAAAASSPVEVGTNYTMNDYDSQGNLLNERNLLTFKDGSTRYLSDIPEDEDLSATY